MVCKPYTLANSLHDMMMSQIPKVIKFKYQAFFVSVLNSRHCTTKESRSSNCWRLSIASSRPSVMICLSPSASSFVLQERDRNEAAELDRMKAMVGTHQIQQRLRFFTLSESQMLASINSVNQSCWALMSPMISIFLLTNTAAVKPIPCHIDAWMVRFGASFFPPVLVGKGPSLNRQRTNF